MNQFMVHSVLDLHDAAIRHRMLPKATAAWAAAAAKMKGDFNYTGFNFNTMCVRGARA